MLLSQRDYFAMLATVSLEVVAHPGTSDEFVFYADLQSPGAGFDADVAELSFSGNATVLLCRNSDVVDFKVGEKIGTRLFVNGKNYRVSGSKPDSMTHSLTYLTLKTL